MGMMNWLWAVIMLLSIIAGAANGRLNDVTNALLGGGGQAITLSLTLGGAMCLWGGMMRIAEKGGLTQLLSRILLMNMAANLLGLGNAATPFGLKAMAELEKCNPQPGVASNHMVVFVVLNTASIQLIPTTVATLRLKYGAAEPLHILPAVWLTSFTAATAALLAAKLLGGCGKIKIRKNSRTRVKRIYECD